MTTPLWRWAEEQYRSRWPQLLVLQITRPGLAEEDTVGLWVDPEGLKALVVERKRPLDLLRGRLGVEEHLAVDLLLAREGGWHERAGAGWRSIPEAEAVARLREGAAHAIPPGLARAIVDSIREDNARELAAGRNLSGVLELMRQQFPRKSLYLFELLQNAVDDGATRVSFRKEGGRLVFQHDGRPFCAADVLGLSSLGVSGKSGRTIGFMGIGFKAVYCRFERVTVSDAVWRFRFERPNQEGDGAWKLLPTWAEDANEPEERFGCRFELDRADGGDRALRGDLRCLPHEVPALLGRRSLAARSASWTLNWGERSYEVTRGAEVPADDAETIQCATSTGVRGYAFMSTRFMPKAKQVEAYRQIRSRAARDAGPGKQEVALFFALDADGRPVAPSDSGGKLFAVLPTATTLPMGYHLQANWLVSTDRQSVLAPAENAWNERLLRELPRLLARLLRWLAAREETADGLATAYAMLPEARDVDGAVHLALLGMELRAESLAKTIRREKVVPVLRLAPDGGAPESGGARRTSKNPRADAIVRSARHVGPRPGRLLDFVSGESVRALPSAFVRQLSSEFLSCWLGTRVFAYPPDSPGRAAAFWTTVGKVRYPTASELQEREDTLADLLSRAPDPVECAWRRIRFLAAFAGAQGVWDVFRDAAFVPIAGGGLARCRDVRRVSADFFGLPQDLQALLGRGVRREDSLLDLDLHRELLQPPAVGDARALVDLADKLFRSVAGTMGLQTLAGRFFQSLVDRELSKEEEIEVLALTRWAARSNRSDVVTHVMVADGAVTRLRPAQETHLAGAYGFPEVECCRGEALATVSRSYLDSDDEDSQRTNWPDFLKGIGCIAGIVLVWQIVRTGETWGSEWKDLRSEFEEKLGPRSSRMTAQLPGRLGVLCSRNWAIVEAAFEPAWADFLLRLQERPERDAASAFAGVLARSAHQVLAPLIAGIQATSRYLVYVPLSWTGWRALAHPTRAPAWLELLRTTPWVPVIGGGQAAPADLLLEPAPSNPGAPRADLPAGVSTGLRPLATWLRFGANVPKPGPLQRLAGGCDTATDGDLVELWREALTWTQANDRETREAELRRLASTRPLLPCGERRRFDDALRVVSGRAVAGRGATLNRWLVPLGAPECPLAPLEKEIARILKLPPEPDGERALDLLSYIWREQPAGKEPREAVRLAWEALARALGGTPSSEVLARFISIREGGRIHLYGRLPREPKGGWYAILQGKAPVPLVDDDPVKAALLEPGDGFVLVDETSLPDSITATLQLRRLSGSDFALAVRPDGVSTAMPDETTRLRRLLRSIAERRSGQDDADDSNAAAAVAEGSEVVVHSCERIRREFSVAGAPGRIDEVRAAWSQRSSVVHVAGASARDYFRDLKDAIATRLRLRSGSPARPLLDVLPVLDDPARFERDLRDARRRVGLPEEEPLADTQPSSVGAHSAASASGAPPGASTAPPGPTASEGSPERRETQPGGRPETPQGVGKGRDEGGGPRERPDRRSPSPGGASRRPGPNRWMILPSGSQGSGDSGGSQPHDDRLARDAVMAYERTEGRKPTELAWNHAGYDIESQDPDPRLLRKIEVKGLEGLWAGGATVQLTRRQFREAWDSPETWLYVVERVGSDRPRVIPIPNVAAQASSFFLQAQAWRGAAEDGGDGGLDADVDYEAQALEYAETDI